MNKRSLFLFIFTASILLIHACNPQNFYKRRYSDLTENEVGEEYYTKKKFKPYSEGDALAGDFNYDEDYDPSLEFKQERDTFKIKKKRKKKSVFYGRKTRRGYTKKGRGDRMVVENFRYLRDWEDPDPYVPHVYWYDVERERIIRTPPNRVKKERALILHGPYKKTVGKVIVEEGGFYIGTKTARWEEYRKKDSVLEEKDEWHKGWPKESKISYWDRDKEKLKEVIPIRYGEKDGYYFRYYKSGRLAEKGQYKMDEKIGMWYEYYDKPRSTKKMTQYPKKPFSDEEPVVVREYDEKGKVTHEAEGHEIRRRSPNLPPRR